MIRLALGQLSTCLPLLVAALIPCATPLYAAKPAEPVPQFETDIKPILEANCVRCHGDQTRKAELKLTEHAALLKGGESGPAITAGKPDESLLLELVTAGEMPPDDAPRLPADDVERIRRWIEAGAPHGESASGETTGTALTQHDVIPILLRRCTVCHGGQYEEGQLDLRTRASMLAGGAGGAAIVPGRPGESPLVERAASGQCPPREDVGEAGIEPMTPEELETVRRWIQHGAPESPDGPDLAGTPDDPLVTEADRQFWSFQPPVNRRPPVAAHRELVSNPIDAFLLAKLEEHDLSFAPEADRLTLLRRASYDLTGLPPEPQEVTRFLGDNSPRAYEDLIDRLLASPRYGERWGRFWLDLAGYADSEGKRHADMVRPYAYRYRDYVLRAFNADKPYDTFLAEQLAGDELVDYGAFDAVTEDTVEKLVATGFLRMAPDGTSADPVNRISDRIETIADEVDVFARGVLGLTIKCAQCHSHKYDPIPQRDYYRLVALFKGAYDEYDWLTPQEFSNQWSKAQRRFLSLATADQRREVEQHNATIQQQIAQLQAERESAAGDASRAKQIQNQIKELEAKVREVPRIRALWDRGRPSPTYIYRRGDETQPTRLVEPGVPAVLEDARSPLVIEPPRHSTPKSGRRLALARWLVERDTPASGLAARVLVNRIWQRHFGAGIVRSLDNFGRTGTPPSHGELLDWLAVEFAQHDWSVKHLHRLIMTSTAYRQSSTLSDEHQQRDPENQWLSRMPMRRLDAEQLRDAMLMVAGRLAERPFGPPDPVEVRTDGLVISERSEAGYRRSVYVRQRRKEMPTILETFDLPQMNPSCSQRMDSTVVSQPLYLLNNKMVYELAADFAGRIRREVGSQPQEQIGHAYLLALGRPAGDEQRAAAIELLAECARHWRDQQVEDPDERALADLCHTLFNAAAFLYID